jgi:threonine dehydrogenase-like Zn-dependent dehydrogenase
VEESYRTARGRQRRRVVAVDVDAVRLELCAPGAAELRDWQRARERIAALVGQGVFDVWFDPLRLAAVDRDGGL